MKAEKTYTMIRNCDCNRHNAQNNNKTNRNPQESDKEFSTIKTLIFRGKATYTRSYAHYPQKNRLK